MQVALYSEIARQPLIAAQEEIKRRGLEPTTENIRSFRTLLLSGTVEVELEDFAAAREFYSLSSFRDLLFHVKEHRFTVSQIREAVAALDLKFISFDLSNAYVPQGFFGHARQDGNMIDFATCERLEQLNPRAFHSMYRFWCQKP
jgi:hypothetical protein